MEEARGYSDNAPEEVQEARKAYRDLVAKYRQTTDKEHDQVVELGGLYIIGTERHESRRIDTSCADAPAVRATPVNPASISRWTTT